MILVIDNYDSFTYNLVQYLQILGATVRVARNDKITLTEVKELGPRGIMLSPGPCTPDQSGVCVSISRSALNGEFGSTPIFGVCLGHQALGEVSGGHVGKAQRVMHGKASPISHDSKGLFAGMPNPFSAIRYHSLVIKQGTLPPEFEVTATSLDDNEIMGIKHRSLPIEGVQFHPESILTEGGLQIVRNFVEQTQTSC